MNEYRASIKPGFCKTTSLRGRRLLHPMTQPMTMDSPPEPGFMARCSAARVIREIKPSRGYHREPGDSRLYPRWEAQACGCERRAKRGSYPRMSSQALKDARPLTAFQRNGMEKFILLVISRPRVISYPCLEISHQLLSVPRNITPACNREPVPFRTFPRLCRKAYHLPA